MAITIGQIDDFNGKILEANNVFLKINESPSQHLGKLVLLERALVFVLENAEGISIPWPKIGLHAIQNTNGMRSVYFMSETDITWPGVYEKVQNNGNNIDDDDTDEGHESDGSENLMTEFWLLPNLEVNPPELIDQIFNAMKQCQTLHPDPADSISEDEDYMEAGDDGADGENQMRNLNLDDDGRFADAEEE